MSKTQPTRPIFKGKKMGHVTNPNRPIPLSCMIGKVEVVLILSKRAPSPHGLMYGTSLPVLSKTVQSKLQ